VEYCDKKSDKGWDRAFVQKVIPFMCKQILNRNLILTKDDIDKCLLRFLKTLWDNGIETKYSCCGHFSTHPDIIFPTDNDFSSLIVLLNKKLVLNDWVSSISSLGEGSWKVDFESIICTPPRNPTWVTTKRDIEEIRAQRKRFFERK